MATPKVPYNFNVDYYEHGLCQYFALEAEKIYHGNICLWLDYDEMNEREVLCHAFLKITDGLYLDAYGPFSSIEAREPEFEYNYMNIVEFKTAEDAKKKLKSLKIPCSKVEDKKNAREFLRNNMLVFDILHNNNMYTMAINCITPVKGYVHNPATDRVLVNNYNVSTNERQKFMHNFSLTGFVRDIKYAHGFKPAVNWYYDVD